MHNISQSIFKLSKIFFGKDFTDKEEIIKEKTGLVVDSYFSSSKIHWILHNVPECNKLLSNNNLLFGTIDCWLIWNLTGNHFTDLTNASRTQLLNIKEIKWDTELLSFFKVPLQVLPELKESADEFGNWEFNGVNIPILGVAGDQQAALFGQECYEVGMAKNTYGTGCFMLLNTGDDSISSQNGLLTTIAWSINGKVNYALEGSVFIAGAAIQWLRDGLKIITHANETEQLANEMGLYSNDIQQLGRLGNDAWRACRLVLDTGMHGMGWSRESAIKFFRENSPIEEINSNIETDRYIAWPGQACSYKMGQLKIEELRRKAENELGDKFDIRYFHDEVLCDGGITLPILENKIESFIQEHKV